ncbi:hypothetical protein COCOBI_01-8420 [Coccomyxa sp. Obi]|nr:hypothetical protein COCOBI_01-8420 [Coccomyxa sp. Obi]
MCGSGSIEADVAAFQMQQQERALAAEKQDIAELAAQVLQMPAARQCSRADLAAAVSADLTQLPLVHTGRQLRKGIRTAVAMDAYPTEEQRAEAAEAGETWVFYPNDLPKRSAYSGDTRWALAPFLAHQALNSSGYKWMLFGGADTVFFPEAVLQALEGFDPQIPYIITDNLWWEGKHGRPMHNNAPRCLPCHAEENRDLLRLTKGFRSSDFNKSALLRPSGWGFAPPVGCPCTPQLLCSAVPDVFEEAPDQDAEACLGDVPFPTDKDFGIHGGAGAIMSIGLLQRLSFSEMEQCVKGVASGNGEAFLTQCLWAKGFAPTDPGFSLYRPAARLFDPFQWSGHDDASQGHGVWEMTNRMKWDVSPEDTCNLECQDLLHYMVSAHVPAGAHASMEQAALEMQRLAAKYEWWWESHRTDSEPTTIYWSIDFAIATG